MNGPVSISWKTAIQQHCGHKHDGYLTYKRSTQKSKAYRKKVGITAFQNREPLILTKIRGAEPI